MTVAQTSITVLPTSFYIASFQRNDDEAEKIWPLLEPLIPKFFENIEIRPSLLHGDLWYGNIGEIPNTEPGKFSHCW